MSPKKKKKFTHRAHKGGEVYIPHKVSNDQRRSKKKFIVATVDVSDTWGWEANNQREVYN